MTASILDLPLGVGSLLNPTHVFLPVQTTAMFSGSVGLKKNKGAMECQPADQMIGDPLVPLVERCAQHVHRDRSVASLKTQWLPTMKLALVAECATPRPFL